MRDYQQKQNVGGGQDSSLSTKDGANEYNSVRDELKTAVSVTELILAPQDGTGEDTTQLSQAMMITGAGASSFQATGTVDAITLTPVTGVGGLKLPPNYTAFHGVRVGFYPTGSNTGNVTISVGQDTGSQFSTKKALNNDGSEISAATLLTTIYAEFVYDETADTATGAFVLVPYSLATGGGGGGDTTKVDKDLFSDVDYVPKVILDGTESFYLDDNGTSKKVLASNITTADTLKVDKDLSDNVDYVPTAVIDDTDDFYVDKAGVPSKIAGLDLKAQLGGSVTLLETRTTIGTWTITSLVIGKPLYVGGDFRSVTINSSRQVRYRVDSGTIIGASPTTALLTYWRVNHSDGANPSTPSFTIIPTASSVVIEISVMNTGTALVAYQ